MYCCFTFNKKSNKCNIITDLAKICVVILYSLIIFAFLFKMNIFKNNDVFAETSDNIEEKLNDKTEDILDEIDFSELENELNDLNISLFDGLDFKGYILKVVKGDDDLSFDKLKGVIIDIIKSDVKGLLMPLILIFIIVLLCNVFKNFKSNKISGVSEVIYLICFSLVVIIISSLLSNSISSAKESVFSVKRKMNIIFPILLSLITAIGGVVSVKAYTPILSYLTETISSVFVYVLLPLFTLSLILSIVGNLSNNKKLDKLNLFVKSLFKWIIGVVFAVFISFVTLKGIIAGAKDGLSIKATKYAIKNYVPILGGYISEGFEIVKAGSLLIKNATGFVSILLLFSIMLKPILSVGLIQLSLKLLAGLIEPIGDLKTSALISDVSKSLRLLIAILVGVALMYFIMVFLLICSASNFV